MEFLKVQDLIQFCNIDEKLIDNIYDISSLINTLNLHLVLI